MTLIAGAARTSETALNFATGLMVREEYGLAIDELTDILKNNPEFGQTDVVLFRLGESYFQTGAIAESIETFERLIARFPDTGEGAQALYRLGQLQSETAPGKAADAFLRLVNRYPDHNLAPTACYWAGEALLREERFADAEATLRRVLDKFPDADVIGHAGYALGLAIVRQPDRYSDALEAFDAFVNSHPESELYHAAALKAAECRYRLGRQDEALEAYHALLNAPDDAIRRDAALGAAWCLFDLERFDEAVDAFLLVAERQDDPDAQAVSRFNAGNAAVRARDYERAVNLFADVFERHPQHELANEARDWQGRGLMRLGRHAEAETVLAALVADMGAPECRPDALYALAEARSALGKHLEAAATFDLIAEHHPEDRLAPAACYAALLEYDAAGDPHAAIARARSLLDRYPESDVAPLARFALGECLFQIGDHAGALAAFEAATGVPPNIQYNLRYKTAWSLYSLKRFDEAQAVFAELAESKDAEQAVEASYMAGRCAIEAGDKVAAERFFKQAAEARDESGFGARATLALANLYLAAAAASDAPEARYHLVVERLEPLLRQANVPEEVRRHASLTLAQALQPLERHADALEVLPDIPAAGEPLADDIAFATAWSQYRIDDPDAALEGFAALADRDGPRSADALFWQARLLEALDPARAADMHAAFRERFPGHAGAREARYREALMRTHAGAPADATTVFRQLADDDPESPFAPHALYDLAWLIKQSDNEEERRARATAIFAELVDRYPDSPLAVDAIFRLGEDAQERGDFAEALAAYLKVQASGAFDEADTLLYRMGWCHLELEQMPQAAAAFESLVADFPDSPLADEARYRAGLALVKLGRHAEAIKWLDSVTDETFVERALFSSAESERARERFQESIERYRRLLAEHPEGRFEVQATLGLAHALRAVGAHADALDAYARVANMTETIEAAQACLGSGYSRLAMGQPREAAREFLKVDIVYGYESLKPEALRMLIACFEQMDDTESVERYRRELITRYPDSADVAPRDS